VDKPHAAHFAVSADIRRLFRDIDDHAVAAILALKPTVAQLEEAAARTAGAGEFFADVRPATGIVAEIIELVGMEEDEFDERQ
jgi:flagellar motor component MotA